MCTDEKSGDSVVFNIAEGSTGQLKAEFKRFLTIALRSAIEVVASLFIAKERKYIRDGEFRKFYDEYEILCKMITGLKGSI